MKIIRSDTSDRSNHINCFKHIKYMTTAAVLTAGLFITGCGSSHAMNTAVDKADKDSYLSANNDNCTVFSIRGDGFYADTYDDWDFPDISSALQIILLMIVHLKLTSMVQTAAHLPITTVSLNILIQMHGLITFQLPHIITSL